MKNNYNENTVAQIVRDDYRTADVFKKFGINFCCGGTVPFEEACLLKGLSPSAVEAELEQASRTVHLFNNLPYNDWRLDFLIDYIVNVHHAYLKLALPSLGPALASFVLSHKKQHPNFENILTTFEKLAALLTANTRHEEEVIFPYIKQMEATHRRKEPYGNLFVKTLRKPLRNIEEEAAKISNLLIELRSLTNRYVFPQNACTNHRVLFQKLEELDNDLMQQKHLENNILFQRAMEMEAELLQL